MRITLIGSRHFGVTTLNMLRQHGVDIARVVVHDGEDRLAAAAKDGGIEVVVQANPKLVTASEIAPNTDLIVTAHSHARVSKEALAAAKLGASDTTPRVAPSPRDRGGGMDHQEGDPIAGGSIYHLADRMDAGAIAAQDWLFVKKGETARELWERALARSANGCWPRSSTTPRPTRRCRPSRRTNSSRPRLPASTVNTNGPPGPIPKSPKARDRGPILVPSPEPDSP
jgi:methionyl-tRNA formyltransferase